MKKISLFIVSVFLINFVTIAQDIKIGYTNVEYILSFLPETKQVQSEVQAYGTQLQNQLQSKITDFQSKADAFQKTAATMTDLIRADKQEELQNLQASIQKFQNEAQAAAACIYGPALEVSRTKYQSLGLTLLNAGLVLSSTVSFIEI